MIQLDKDLNVAYDLLNRRKLRWCKGGICACMGCANNEISKSQWDRIVEIPEIKVILDQQRRKAQEEQKRLIERLRNL